MDSIPSYEFHRIFEQVSDDIDLTGKTTAVQIERELVKNREYCLRKYERATSAKERAMYITYAVRFNQLIEQGFAERTIREASKDPNGFIAVTLKYGISAARLRKLLAQKRAQNRMRLLGELGR